jgi:hypothetical protein
VNCRRRPFTLCHCSVASKSRPDAWRMERDSCAWSFDQASHLNLRPEQSCLAYIICVLERPQSSMFSRGNISVYRPPWRAPFLWWHCDVQRTILFKNGDLVRGLRRWYLVPVLGSVAVGSSPSLRRNINMYYSGTMSLHSTARCQAVCPCQDDLVRLLCTSYIA